MNYIGVLEGLLFVVGEDGLTLNQIKDILEIDDDTVKELIKDLKDNYEGDNRGIRLTILGDSFKLTTKKEHKEYYKKLLTNKESNTLSAAALETLAIVAYNEPITRLMVDELRGVSTSQMMRKLVAKGLIKEVGRSDLPGRPILYQTTSDFLDYFGLSSKDELPDIKTSTLDKEEVDLYNTKYKE
ncbi:MAG: SMC-Scp complex subunit ScpB [Bacilli bacterium]